MCCARWRSWLVPCSSGCMASCSIWFCEKLDLCQSGSTRFHRFQFAELMITCVMELLEPEHYQTAWNRVVELVDPRITKPLFDGTEFHRFHP